MPARLALRPRVSGEPSPRPSVPSRSSAAGGGRFRDRDRGDQLDLRARAGQDGRRRVERDRPFTVPVGRAGRGQQPAQVGVIRWGRRLVGSTRRTVPPADRRSPVARAVVASRPPPPPRDPVDRGTRRPAGRRDGRYRARTWLGRPANRRRRLDSRGSSPRCDRGAPRVEFRSARDRPRGRRSTSPALGEVGADRRPEIGGRKGAPGAPSLPGEEAVEDVPGVDRDRDVEQVVGEQVVGVAQLIGPAPAAFHQPSAPSGAGAVGRACPRSEPRRAGGAARNRRSRRCPPGSGRARHRRRFGEDEPEGSARAVVVGQVVHPEAPAITNPSAESTSSSIATSPPPLAASVGPVYFIGTTPRSIQDCTGVAASSRSVIETVACAVDALGAGLLDPLAERRRVDDAALERDVADLVHARDLADVVLRLVAVAVLGDGDLGAEAGDVGEAAEAPRSAVPRVDEEIERAVGRRRDRPWRSSLSRSLLSRGRRPSSGRCGR